VGSLFGPNQKWANLGRRAPRLTPTLELYSTATL